MDYVQRNVQKKLERFRESIMKEAGQRCQEILRTIDEERAVQLDKYKDDARNDSNELLQKEQEKIAVETARSIAERKTELRRELAEKREELSRGIFEKAEKALRDFAAGEEYRTFFIRKATHITSMQVGGEVKLYVRKEDLRFAPEILRICGKDCPLIASEKIGIGGVIGFLGETGTWVDESLDTLLEDQKEWFYSHAGAAAQ